MDKLQLADWANQFSSIEQKLLTKTDRYTEVNIHFEEAGLAEGTFSIIQTPGLTLNHVIFDVENPLTMVRKDSVEMAESVFVLEGCIHSDFDRISNPLVAEKQHHGLHYNQEFTGKHVIKPGRFDAYQINFHLPFFKSIVHGAEDRLLDAIGNSVERHEPYLATSDNILLQPQMLEIIRAINNCRFSGITKCLYAEAKVLELFTHQMEHFSKRQILAQDCISKADREKLKAVRAYIQANYLAPLSLAQISTEFGLNEFKLKKGYKELFHTTVFGHILDFRMLKAKQLLEEGHLNISQVSDFIGYSNLAAFSGSFKKKFGYTPSKYAKSNLVGV